LRSDPFHGKVALVTGAGSGIGRASSIAFAQRGARTVVADRAPSDGNATVERIQKLGGEAIFIKTDVTKPDQVARLIEQTVQRYGRLDYAHNNAGMLGPIANTVDWSQRSWDRVMGLNLTSVWVCMQHELRQMLNQGSGAIVNTSSVGGLVGVKGGCAYSASKHGMIGLTKTAALEYAQENIRVNAVCPGLIRTPMVERVIRYDSQLEAEMIASEPIGRLGTPEEVAHAVVWLCGDEASFVTGHAMVVDGGMFAQ